MQKKPKKGGAFSHLIMFWNKKSNIKCNFVLLLFPLNPQFHGIKKKATTPQKYELWTISLSHHKD